MNYTVRLTPEAVADLVSIHRYVADANGHAQADDLINRLEIRIRSLGSLPGRGNRPPELLEDPMPNVHELHEPPFRIIYQIIRDVVYVHYVLDARRNVSDILADRPLR